jgi:oligopeptide transport system permease protein
MDAYRGETHLYRYILNRLVLCLISLVVIITITFFLMHAIPGGPFDPAGLEQFSAKVRENMIAKFGLDKPLISQYLKFWKNLFQGDLGVSISYNPRSVVSVIQRQLPVSSKLGAISLVVVLLVGIGAGVYAALRQNAWQDTAMKVITPLLITIPSFVLCTLLIYVFGVKLGEWGKAVGPINVLGQQVQIRGLPFMRLESAWHYILPVVALSGGQIPYLARLSRSSMLDVVRQDYIRTARAKGLPERKVIYKHAMKNAMLPIFTFIGPMIISMLTSGSMVIERMFAIPGIGGELVMAIGNRDYPMILGLTTYYSFIMVATYLTVDIVYAFLDPRIRLATKD